MTVFTSVQESAFAFERAFPTVFSGKAGYDRSDALFIPDVSRTFSVMTDSVSFCEVPTA